MSSVLSMVTESVYTARARLLRHNNGISMFLLVHPDDWYDVRHRLTPEYSVWRTDGGELTCMGVPVVATIAVQVGKWKVVHE